MTAFNKHLLGLCAWATVPGVVWAGITWEPPAPTWSNCLLRVPAEQVALIGLSLFAAVGLAGVGLAWRHRPDPLARGWSSWLLTAAGLAALGGLAFIPQNYPLVSHGYYKVEEFSLTQSAASLGVPLTFLSGPAIIWHVLAKSVFVLTFSMGLATWLLIPHRVIWWRRVLIGVWLAACDLPLLVVFAKGLRTPSETVMNAFFNSGPVYQHPGDRFYLLAALAITILVNGAWYCAACANGRRLMHDDSLGYEVFGISGALILTAILLATCTCCLGTGLL